MAYSRRQVVVHLSVGLWLKPQNGSLKVMKSIPTRNLDLFCLMLLT